MSTHTPGPWTLRLEPNPVVYRGHEGGFAVMGLSREREEADARLIAAAPEMLEALRTIAEQGGDIVEPWAAEIARAAIAKAEGLE